MKIREFFNRQMQNMFLQYRYGETVDSVQQIKNSVSVLYDDIKLTEDVPNWQQKRGIYRVKVKPRHEGFALDDDAKPSICGSLETNLDRASG